MSVKHADTLNDTADRYVKHAYSFEPASLGRVANLAEARKYRDLADRALDWPDVDRPTHTTDGRALCRSCGIESDTDTLDPHHCW